MLRFLLILILFCAAVSADDNVEVLIEQLGADSFTVRQRAETKLLKLGKQAYPYLRTAKQNSDVEVSHRAEFILGKIEAQLNKDMPSALLFWVQQYTLESNPAAKARIIRLLADPFSDANSGEGVEILCRIVQFDDNIDLRNEAVKCLIASPPNKHSLQIKWFTYIKETFNNCITEDDVPIKLLYDYAVLRCGMQSPDFPQKVQQWVKHLADWQAEADYSVVQPGSPADILMYYAAAVVQDKAGLKAERDKSVTAALSVKSEKQKTELQIDLDDNWELQEHAYTGRWLKQRYYLHWALPHFEKVISDGHVMLRVQSAKDAAEVCMLLADYDAALRFHDMVKTVTASEEYKKRFSSDNTDSVMIRWCATLAEKYIAAKNYDKAKEFIDKGLQRDRKDIDLLISAYQYCQHSPNADADFRQKIKSAAYEALVGIEQGIYRTSGGNLEDRRENAVQACNQAAWLLANTGGDAQTALALAKAAVNAEPEDASVLDTLAMVYEYSGDLHKAIEIETKAVQTAPEVVVFTRTLERMKAKQKYPSR